MDEVYQQPPVQHKQAQQDIGEKYNGSQDYARLQVVFDKVEKQKYGEQHKQRNKCAPQNKI
jgi:hypothetical protein